MKIDELVDRRRRIAFFCHWNLLTYLHGCSNKYIHTNNLKLIIGVDGKNDLNFPERFNRHR